jgi:hypothetical protein
LAAGGAAEGVVETGVVVRGGAAAGWGWGWGFGCGIGYVF